MKSPIVIAAFGTTSKAQETYSHLHTKLSALMAEREIFWAYSSKMITRSLQSKGEKIVSPDELLQQLGEKGHSRATVQSLHLFPGTEFHSLLQTMRDSTLQCAVGLPLLTTPVDYEEIAELLGPTITHRAESTILILGHGTEHPSWTGYYSFEKILKKKYGDKIHVGVVEKYPDSSTLVNELSAAGTSKVTIIPLFLICGMHYRRDIIADDSSSWLSMLEAHGIQVEVIDHGLGLLPGIEKVLHRHIMEAEEQFK